MNSMHQILYLFTLLIHASNEIVFFQSGKHSWKAITCVICTKGNYFAVFWIHVTSKITPTTIKTPKTWMYVRLWVGFFFASATSIQCSMSFPFL